MRSMLVAVLCCAGLPACADRTDARGSSLTYGVGDSVTVGRAGGPELVFASRERDSWEAKDMETFITAGTRAVILEGFANPASDSVGERYRIRITEGATGWVHGSDLSPLSAAR